MNRSAAIVVPCNDLAAALAFLLGSLEFRVERISPADDPSIAIVSGHGLRLCLDRNASGPRPTIRLERSEPLEGVPEDLNIELADPTRSVLPPADPSLVISHADADTAWIVGRAGMRYRDLIPGRQGGRVVASHIVIAKGGPVADYVHHHDVRFQLIFCRAGSATLVYEGQGPPFRLEPGDCVLQPPGIRHQVLNSSDGLEVVEISAPAVHDTYGDLALTLPSSALEPERRWQGQSFLHSRSHPLGRPKSANEWSVRDCGVGDSSGGVARASVHRAGQGATRDWPARTDGMLFCFVLSGSIRLECRDPRGTAASHRLGPADSATIPAAIAACATALETTELLVVELEKL